MQRRAFSAALGAMLAAASAPTPVPAQNRAAFIRAPRLKAGDTIALINPSGAVFEREPYAIASETLRTLGFKVREAPHLRARYGHLAGTDRQRADDVNATFADPAVHGLLAMGGGSGGNLEVLASMAGSPYWPRFDGSILLLEDDSQVIHRVDRMLSTLKLAGALSRLAGVVLDAFTHCTPGEGYATLTLDEVFDDCFKPLNVPVYRGAQFGHLKRQFTLPIGLPVEMDAGAGTLRFLSAAVA